MVWRTEPIKTEGKSDEPAACADVDIPSRGLQMRISLKRNLDPALPASHVIELTFQVSTNFAGGDVANVPGILMKPNEAARGTALAGLSVRVTDALFMDGLAMPPPLTPPALSADRPD